MAELKTVLAGLRQCMMASNRGEFETQCMDCPYFNPEVTVEECMEPLREDAFVLLKAQQGEIERLQPRKGKWIFTGQKNAYGGTVIQCPFCDDKYAAQNPSDEHFCRNCGAKLMD